MNKYFCIALMIILLSGCKTKYEKVEFEDKNPTKYCFDFPYKKVKNAIKIEFDKAKFKNRYLYFKDDDPFLEKGSEIFKEESNKFDAILTGDNFYSKSYIYYKNDMLLDDESVFQIHISSISEDKTCLEVVNINPRIKIGVYLMFTHDLSFKGPKYITVEPSTIEEYEILYLIGKRLGQKDMPAVKYPDSSCKRTKLNYYTLFDRAD